MTSGGTTITLNDNHGCKGTVCTSPWLLVKRHIIYLSLKKDPVELLCTHCAVCFAGKDSGKLPANRGVIPGTLADSVDSFILCA